MAGGTSRSHVDYVLPSMSSRIIVTGNAPPADENRMGRTSIQLALRLRKLIVSHRLLLYILTKKDMDKREPGI